jgi:hypothetical protein
MALGATLDDWAHFDFVLGLAPNLLPCVPASEGVQVAEGSALAGKVGKIPSMFNGRGEAHGLLGWQRRDILPAEVAAWSQDRRLNLCVRTGPISGIYAFDIDIDGADALTVVEIIDRAIGECAPVRARSGSLKRLLMFRMEEPCKKRKIKLDESPRGPAIELLADGQQFVAAGTHPSGVRYQWSPSLPSSIPTITMAQLDSIWTALSQTYAKTTSTPVTVTAATTTAASSQELMTSISEEDWQHLLACLRFLLDKVQDNDSWSELGYALLSLQRSDKPAERLWLDFSAKAVGYEPGAAEAWWQAHARQEPRTDYRHIFNMARQRGMLRVGAADAFEPVPETEPHSDLVDVVPPEVAPRERALVRLSGANFSGIVDQLEAAIEPHVYTQGANLVRTNDARTVGAIQRSTDALMLIPATPEWTRKKFGEICDFEKWVKGDWERVAPNAEYINNMLGLGSWATLRPLDAIARAPFLREDGTICDAPGYDPGTRTLYSPAIAFPPIPPNPTRDDALLALARIRAPFNEFPWKEEASESAFVSHVLAEASRLAMARCPMYFYDAPVAGTGKSTLQEMAARIVHGTEPAMRPWVKDEDELRKSLYACLMAGDRSIWFDNLPDGIKVRSATLETFLTAAVWKDRTLGESTTTEIPNKTVLVASGNNVTPVAALARRSIVVRLDANTENLRGRVFRIADPRRYVMEHRAALLVDAITIIRAYLISTPTVTMPTTLPSFEQWSRLAREPLIWLGMADPVITQINETDDELQNIGPIFERLFASFGSNNFSAAEMARVVGSISDERNELSDALTQMGCSEPTHPKHVGYWLRAAKDKIGSNLKLVHDGYNQVGVKWKLKRLGGGLT